MATHEKITGPNKTDAGNGSYGICRVIDASRSPSPDPRRSPFMRAFRAILALFVLSLADTARCAEPLDEEFLRGFMAGDYDVIGRKPDSTTTYSGRITLRVEGNVLLATRIIEGTTTKATVRFDTVAGADRIPVVRMRFALEGVEYEATYHWQSDSDNYPRFTGIIYRVDHQTKSPGLEAFFPTRK